MDWKDIAGMVGKAAPLMGTLLAGPAGGAVGSLIGAALGTANADETAAVIAGDPGTLVKLREIEATNKADLERLAVQAEGNRLAAETEALKVAAADRADARKREIATADSWTPRALAGLFVVGWFGVQAYLLQHVVPQEMREIIMRTLGTMDMALGLVLGYYFGSSSSSRAKDELIAKGAASHG